MELNERPVHDACSCAECGGDKKANLENAKSKIEAASQAGSDLIVLPVMDPNHPEHL